MFDKYRVKENETIDEIALRFNTSVDYILDINNMTNDYPLREGLDIIVPKNKEKYFDTYTINKGDTLYAISRKYNINPELLAALNGIDADDYIYPNQVILLPVGNYSYYITKEGDTLDVVASLFGRPKENIIKENETIYLMPSQIIVSKRK